MILTVLLLAPYALAQQETPPPKMDIFGGYAWLKPGEATVTGIPLKNAPKGWGAAVTFNLNRFLGLTLDSGAHYGDFFRIGTIMGGPRLKFRSGKIEPFAEGLFGLHRLTFSGQSPNNNVGVAVGGGLDVPVTRNLQIRPVQADYVWGRHDFTPLLPNKFSLNGVRVRSGVVFSLASAPPPPPMTASCMLQPNEVFDGEPVTLTASAQNVPKNHTVTFSFSTSGGKLQAKDNVANVDTTGLAPGSYRVRATVTDPKEKKAAPATCDASFAIKERPKHPPAITCSASPTTVKAGEPATITCTVQNPDNRPLTYNWASTGGKLSPHQTTATLDTTGAAAGPINITTRVSDDRGLSASTTTTVNVEVPPPPPQPSKITEIAFKKNSARVDNTAKAILDDVALRLQREADAKAVIVGFFDPETEEREGERLAAQRAVNTKAYLVQEKGIDPARIEVRTGTAGGTRAEVWLVPAGATFSAAGTTPVDETKIKAAKPKPRRAIRARRARRAAPAKPKR
jgi:outer membrane protein OmpA-like peptidoglycan-associated protein